MPSLAKHQSSVTTKLLFIGDSGGGKTGALASLADAGYSVRILDLDNGIDILKNVLSDPRSPYKPDAITRIHYITVTDPMKNVNGKLIPIKASVWDRSIALLQHWKDDENDFGPVVSWGSQDILVIDSLTFLSKAALNKILAMNGRLGAHPQLQDWGAGQALVESLLEMLYDEGVKCNVIVNCHIAYLGEENGPQRGYPNTLGKSLPPKVGRYFNSILMARTVGQGAAERHKILTRTSGNVELKNSAPLSVLPEYPIETGLADYFKAVRAQVPQSSASASLTLGQPATVIPLVKP